MPTPRCDEIVREQVHRLPAGLACHALDPEVVFDVGLRVSAALAFRSVQVTYRFLEAKHQSVSLCLVGLQVQMLELLFDDPVAHRIDVQANHIAAETVGFDEGRAAPHKWIGDRQPAELVAAVVGIAQRPLGELREE